MKVLGLTGSIGSGKSTVSRFFQALGAEVIDADVIAREVVRPGEPAWDEIVEEFGEEVLTCNLNLDRKKLAEIIFADKEKREKLNRITHPRIIGKIRELVDRYRQERKAEAVIIEAALIVERGGLGELISGLIVVTADENAQVERLTNERGFTREEALARIRAQMSSMEKAAHATYVIDNSGSLEDTARQVNALWREIKNQ